MSLFITPPFAFSSGPSIKLSSDLSLVTLHRDVDLLRFEAVSANVGAVGNLELEQRYELESCGQQVLLLLEHS